MMRIGVAQTFITDSIEINADTVLKMAEEGARRGAKLLAFPEMSLTGYNPKTLGAPAAPEKIAAAMNNIAGKISQLDIGIILGRGEFDNGKLYNAASVLLPDGTTHTYRKINLTSAEAKFFSPGNAPLVFDYYGEKFGVIICRDQNYPDLSRQTCSNGIGALFILSAHYYHPAEARWKLEKNRALPIARAVENRCHVLLANAVGSHIGMVSLGHSLIANPEGALVIEAGEGEEAILTTDLGSK